MTIKNLMMEYDVILASASPRRKELMQLICPSFRVIPADCGEAVPEAMNAADVPAFLSYQKCKCIADVYQKAVVIGCDTVVTTADGEILGKPKDEEDAARMLRLLSGRMHTVDTGVSICYKGRTETFTETTKVWFKDLTDEEIEDYINTGEPMDKAGAYGIQGEGTLLVDKIEGDFFNVVGLPVSKLAIKLHDMLD
ncbi:Maf family protein [Ruminococcus albus]|uniref:dTTP/UTP pyrophosphatase n=1 Tax=Ruminococcus albus (strain ATCC 27210 / DSM 20455 / JCM 14654 / NCDO 2250 / 7) TaxID=697329 RepID=E6UBS7_RUMA7|nr:Maf family protein [Ruminococcus albus]ADU20669.1 maf protein [Ruminococcus albus 7 = DSM 20455]